eukprot:scaffold405_cov179-Ochromonas_danica.AAC.10
MKDSLQIDRNDTRDIPYYYYYYYGERAIIDFLTNYQTNWWRGDRLPVLVEREGEGVIRLIVIVLAKALSDQQQHCEHCLTRTEREKQQKQKTEQNEKGEQHCFGTAQRCSPWKFPWKLSNQEFRWNGQPTKQECVAGYYSVVTMWLAV